MHQVAILEFYMLDFTIRLTPSRQGFVVWGVKLGLNSASKGTYLYYNAVNLSRREMNLKWNTSMSFMNKEK